ncbi:RTA1 like protein-domain-containing protein [Mycena maculata]|uniref:RTA1 like protein-domain-containing protein n=1 Tax=Mycena maculata TaxID=230809 RepID=A0AAD7IQC5_9AGAR|nr:RTA1 like protein-domain-containing protein [Mycena maculata]
MPLFESPYGYTPTEYVCLLYLVLFSVSTLVQAGQATYYRLWWLLPTACLAGMLEIAGWSARLWSAIAPLNFHPYEMQIICTIIGPTPLAAANFIILGHIITRLGPMYSRLSPKLYTAFFLCCDIISLVIQGMGGGLAAGAVAKKTNPAHGGNIMLGGICFQMVTITVYALFAGEFILRFLKNRPLSASPPATPPILAPRMKVLLYALMLNTTCLFIRAVYRVFELADGYNGRIIQTQVYFNVLDGAMITIAMFTLNFAHPGAFLFRATQPIKNVESDSREGDIVMKLL